MNAEAIKNSLWERSEELSRIEEALWHLPYDNGSSYVHFFWGISGVGKTKLFDYVTAYVPQISQETGDNLHFLNCTVTDSADFTEYRVIRNFYQRASKMQDFSFPRYESANKYLFNLTQDSAYRMDTLNNSEILSGLSSAISSQSINELASRLVLAGIVSGANPIYGISKDVITSIAKSEVKKAANTAKSEYKKRNFRGFDYTCFLNDLSYLSQEEIRENLTKYFVEDLNGNIELLNERDKEQGKSHYCVFAIDAFEKRFANTLNDWISNKLISKINQAVWFIFSTESKWTPQIDPQPFVLSHKVLPFDRNSLPYYLLEKGIRTEEDQNFIIEKSKCLPAAVDILIRIYSENRQNFDALSEIDGYKDLFKQYFSKHLTQKEQCVFNRLALFDSWDIEVFRYVADCDLCNGLFEKITHNTALVEPIYTEDAENKFHMIDIAQKTLRALLAEKPGEFEDAHKCQYNYEKECTDSILSSLEVNPLISNTTYQALAHHSKSAFSSAVAYYYTKADFEEISNWCTKTQQCLSPKSLFQLKAELTGLYLDSVDKKDHFRFDTESDTKKRYRHSNMRDQIWAYRNLGSLQTSISLAGIYYMDILRKYGITSIHMPFSSYLLGLTFHDAGDYETAEWLYKQSISIQEEITKDSVFPFNTPAIVRNVLGCIYMDQDKFEEAKTQFEQAIQIGNEKKLHGHRIWYNNLQRLYFRWAQSLAKVNPKDTKVKEYLDLCDFYTEKEKTEVKSNSLADRGRTKSRKAVFRICSDRLNWTPKDEMPRWEEEIQILEQVIKELNGLESKSERPMVYSIQNNIAVIHALHGDYKRAQKEFANCLDQKQRYYGVSPDGTSPIQKKPSLRETRQNLESATTYVEEPGKPLNPYDFILQF